MTEDSYCEISEYFGIPTEEQLITNRHDRFLNRFRSQRNYVCQALIMWLKFVSFLSSTVVYLYLLVLFVLNCYATILLWWNKVIYCGRNRSTTDLFTDAQTDKKTYLHWIDNEWINCTWILMILAVHGSYSWMFMDILKTDLKTACRTVSHKPCTRSMVSAYRVCEHYLLTILLTWSLIDSLFEITPSILIEDIRRMCGSNDGWVSWHFLFPSIITISSDLPRLRVRLLAFAHSAMLSNSRLRLSALIAGMMR